MPYLGSPLSLGSLSRVDPSMFGNRRRGELFNPEEFAAANGPGRDFDLTMDPRSAFLGLLNDPYQRATLGRQGALAAAATSGGLASDTQRGILQADPEPSFARDQLRAAIMDAQGMREYRQQQAAQEKAAGEFAQQANRQGVLENRYTAAENQLVAMMQRPDVYTPQDIQTQRGVVSGLAARLEEFAGLSDPAAQGTTPVAPPRSLREITEEVNERVRRGETQERKRPPVSPQLQAILADPDAARMLLQMRNR